MKVDEVLVLDFGGQYSHLIARRVRECMVYSELAPSMISPDEILNWGGDANVKGIILSGGPQSVFDPKAPTIDKGILNLDIPILGLCFGHQLIASLAGGLVKPAETREFGSAYVTIDKPAGVLKGLGQTEKVWMSHSDTVYALPEDYEILAHTKNCPIAAFRHSRKAIHGLQWHPEVAHTVNGKKMLENFLFRVCGCRSNWIIKDLATELIDDIKHSVGDGKAIVALSGGIDSSTVVALAARALGRKLSAVFVDHGFMRESEPSFIKRTFEDFNFNFIAVDARKRFLERIRNISDPEEKRKIIGEEFIHVFEEEAKKVGAEYLIQGTIYPDRIESGYGKHSDKIKTHHNVAGLPKKTEFQAIIEPVKDLYKDEVRLLAKTLDLPDGIVNRQPFPGPGLAVRIMGCVTEDKLRMAKRADKIVCEEFEKSVIKNKLWQYFAIVTKTKSTGVKGDARAYGHTIAVRVVESREAMTANFANIPYSVLERISSRITNEIPEITRVVYDITHKPPATIEWE